MNQGLNAYNSLGSLNSGLGQQSHNSLGDLYSAYEAKMRPAVPARPKLEWYPMSTPRPEPEGDGTTSFLIYDVRHKPRFVAVAFEQLSGYRGGGWWRTSDGENWCPTHWSFIADQPEGDYIADDQPDIADFDRSG